MRVLNRGCGVGVGVESPGVWVLAWSLSFEGDSYSGPYLSHLDCL